MRQAAKFYTPLTVLNIGTAADHRAAIIFQKQVNGNSHS
jgi:hypothetical protein